jgi:hypothetical protein
MKLRLELESTGGNTAGFRIPDQVVDELMAGRRPKVVATVGDYSWRSSIARMGDSFWLGVSMANRAAAGIEAGQTLDLDVVVDDVPRIVKPPDDLAAELATHPAAADGWARLSYSKQRDIADAIDAAKKPETRARRVQKALAELS